MFAKGTLTAIIFRLQSPLGYSFVLLPLCLRNVFLLCVAGEYRFHSQFSEIVTHTKMCTFDEITEQNLKYFKPLLT